MEVAALDPVSNHLVMALAKLQQAPAVFVLDIDYHGARRLNPLPGEENGLRLEVTLHSSVIVEMIAREVRKEGHLEGDAEGPLLLQGVRRDFHDGFGATRLNGVGEELIELERFGRGARRGIRLIADTVLNRADQSDAAAGGPQHTTQNKGCCGLAIRPGDAGDHQLFGGMVIEIGAKAGQRTPAVRNPRPRYSFARRQ